MLAIKKILVPRIVAHPIAFTNSASKISSSSIRQYSIISPDPGYTNETVGPYPRTKEERERAAKKYNLIPEDYEPYDEGDALGDYPKLPDIGTFNRDKYDDYDDPTDMRFYGEPLHLHHDLYSYEREDPQRHLKQGIPYWKKMLIMWGAFFSLPAIYYLANHNDININHNFKQREIFPNQKLYEFPASESDHH